jgi:hypothetical protein
LADFVGEPLVEAGVGGTVSLSEEAGELGSSISGIGINQLKGQADTTSQALKKHMKYVASRVQENNISS